MKKSYIFILIVLMIPIVISNGNAQTLNIDIQHDELREIDESKYRASGVTVTRNAEGELISVIRVDASRYLDHPIVDEFLTQAPTSTLVKKGTLGGDTISHYRVIVDYMNPVCSEILFEVPGFNDRCNWHQSVFSTLFMLEDNDNPHTAFRGLNHSFIVKSGYDLTTFWDIFIRE